MAKVYEVIEQIGNDGFIVHEGKYNECVSVCANLDRSGYVRESKDDETDDQEVIKFVNKMF